MKIFISHASEQTTIAQDIELALRAEGHDAFLDTATLPEGDAYNARIRAAVSDCDLFVFLVSPEAVADGRYTRTELRFAEEKWPAPAGHVLPVMVAPTPPQSIPPFLRAVVILRPGGNVAAEVVAAVARRARPRWAVVLRRAAIPFVVVAVVGAAAGIWRISERRRACGEASRLGREGALQQEAGDFAAAWDRYADALELCPGSDELAGGRERLAMAWLDDIRVTVGKETFTDIVIKVQPALSRAAVSPEDRRAADALAHLGWGDFLRSREGQGGLDPVRYYREAVSRDPRNPYAEAMWGHFILQSGGSWRDAREHFDRALASGERRPFVRRMELQALLWRDDTEVQGEVILLASEMRQNGESLPPATRQYSLAWRIWDVYYARLVNGEERERFVAVLPPQDHLATFRWLFPEGTVPADKRRLYLYMLGQLQELAGERAAALETYRSLDGLLASQGVTDGRLADDARAAIRRLRAGTAGG